MGSRSAKNASEKFSCLGTFKENILEETHASFAVFLFCITLLSRRLTLGRLHKEINDLQRDKEGTTRAGLGGVGGEMEPKSVGYTSN
jgi:hypothetical protein